MTEDCLLERVDSTIRHFNMLPQGSRVVVGVSGGPDSTTLLHLLCQLRKDYHLYLWAAHLNHQIREVEAEEDEKWVKLFVGKLGIPLTVDTINVPVLARKKKQSLEFVARQVRYNFLEHFANRVQADKIAVGHTASDQAETVLMRLTRGSGVDGLAGIPPVRGRIIRPLIRAFRWEIEHYCQRNKLDPREDSSNKEPHFFRNRVRLELIPYLSNHYNPRVVETISRTAELVQKDKELLDGITEKAKAKVVKKKRGREIVANAKALSTVHLSLQRRVIRSLLEELKGDLGGIEYSHIEQILRLKEGEGTKLTSLPGEFEVRRQYNELVFKKGEQESPDFFSHLSIPGVTNVPELNVGFEAEILPEPPAHFPRDRYQGFFDLENIPEVLYVRPRREGDRFVPLGMGDTKKLKDFFIDSKIPKFERNEVPILAGVRKNEENILWVVGYRIDDRFKIKNDSKKVLHIKVVPYARSTGKQKDKRNRN